MFGRRRRQLEAAYKDSLEVNQALRNINAQMYEAAKLINVRADGRELILTFQRGPERFELTTYLTNASDIKGLKKWAKLP